MTLRSRGPSKSRGKSKLLYLHYHNATKRGRMVIYLNGLLTITSCNAFISGLVKSRDKQNHVSTASVYGHQC